MHRITIGNVEVTALLDTNLLMNPRHFMPAHADEFVKQYGDQADARGLYPMSITCYLLRSAGKTLLVDTGLGPRSRPGFPKGQLPDALKAANVDPGEIDLIVNTHLHIDHVGWNTVEDEGGKTQVFFPKATWIIQQNEWEYWMQPEFLEAPGNDHLRECVAPIEGHAKLVSAESALDEHLTFIPTPGHTPGHVAIGIASQGERAVIVGDASHHPVQLEHPDWSPAFDVDPVLSAESRDRLFDEAAADGRTWIAGHWQHPGFGRIVRLEGKRVFQAL
ncbi:MAG: MBL fold metallo-hydrolase [Dehalococcoidia bacterium]|nr:MBL fold metallo-hydrolase [Dehalococcoidia bacterium]